MSCDTQKFERPDRPRIFRHDTETLSRLTIYNNFLPSLTRTVSGRRLKEYGWPETPCIHVYTYKGWDRWRKRTRALRNTRLAFCRAASAFIKESLAPSLSSASSSSPPRSTLLASLSLFPSLSFSLSRASTIFFPLFSSSERISALRFFVLSSCCSPSFLAPFPFYNFLCLSRSLSLFLISNGKSNGRIERTFSCIKILRRELEIYIIHLLPMQCLPLRH